MMFYVVYAISLCQQNKGSEKMQLINTLKIKIMKTKELTINLGGKRVVFEVCRPYEGGSGFSVTHDGEVICDGYRSGNWFYFLSMSKKVDLFEEIFKAEVRKSLNLLFK